MAAAVALFFVPRCCTLRATHPHILSPDEKGAETIETRIMPSCHSKSSKGHRATPKVCVTVEMIREWEPIFGGKKVNKHF